MELEQISVKRNIIELNAIEEYINDDLLDGQFDRQRPK